MESGNDKCTDYGIALRKYIPGSNELTIDFRCVSLDLYS